MADDLRPVITYPSTQQEAWRRIEQEARNVALCGLDRDENTPLEFGAFIAWMTYRHGLTDDTSPLHRVGEPIGISPHTTCGEVIPPPISWIPLGAGLVRTLHRCRFCEAEHKRFLEANNAVA